MCNHPDLFEGRTIVSSFDMEPLTMSVPSIVAAATVAPWHRAVNLQDVGLMISGREELPGWAADESAALRPSLEVMMAYAQGAAPSERCRWVAVAVACGAGAGAGVLLPGCWSSTACCAVPVPAASCLLQSFYTIACAGPHPHVSVQTQPRTGPSLQQSAPHPAYTPCLHRPKPPSPHRCPAPYRRDADPLVRSAAQLRAASQKGLDGSQGPSGIYAAQQQLQQNNAALRSAMGSTAYRVLAASLQAQQQAQVAWRAGRTQLLHMVNERRCAQRPVYGSSLVKAVTLEAPVDMPFLRGWHGPNRLQLLPGLLLETACSYEVRAGSAAVQMLLQQACL